MFINVQFTVTALTIGFVEAPCYSTSVRIKTAAPLFTLSFRNSWPATLPTEVW